MKIPELDYNFDDELSLKDFFNKDLSKSGIDFNDKFIYGTSFGNESPDFETFPKGMTGVTFVNCNLDIIIIPKGNTYIYTNGLSKRRLKVQNDLNYWLIDEDDNPIKIADFKIFDKLGLPLPDPKDIPKEQLSEYINLVKVAQDLKSNQEII